MFNFIGVKLVFDIINCSQEKYFVFLIIMPIDNNRLIYCVNVVFIDYVRNFAYN